MMSENKLDSVIRLGYILRVWLRICLILCAKDVIVKVSRDAIGGSLTKDGAATSAKNETKSVGG